MRRGGANQWLAWAALYLVCTPGAAAEDIVLSGIDPPIPVAFRHTQAGRSPVEIPLLNHDIPTAKFRDTNNEIERYQAVAPASQQPAVRAPSVQSVESSKSLSPLGQARLLSEWEADDIILLSTIDGALHARDRKTGRKRWTLEIDNSPMIETTNHPQNRSTLDELLPMEEYMFIVEPSSDGELFAQFADPQVGLIKLSNTVRKMAADSPSYMNVKGYGVTTTSMQESKAYTVDAQTGQILQEFPRSKTSSPNKTLQPHCRPRSGLDFEDSACKPERTIRIGRNTYTFTISSDATLQDLCTIRFSEWVTNNLDRDLQSQHTTALDDYDVRTFHNGVVMGLDTTGEHGSQHRYKYMLDAPVAKIFDVARKIDTEDESTDSVLLTRSVDYIAPGGLQSLRHDFDVSQRVFVNRTERGEWYAMSELHYPGVTTTAPLAKYDQSKQPIHQRLDLQGDLTDIIGVHRMTAVQQHPEIGHQQKLTIEAPAPGSDLMPQLDKSVALSWRKNAWYPVPDTVEVKYLIYFFSACMMWAIWSRFRTKRPAVASLDYSLQPMAETSVTRSESSADAKAVATPAITLLSSDSAQEMMGSDIQITPSHSRIQSMSSLIGSPKKSRTVENDESDAGDSDEDGSNMVQTEEEPQKKKTKRGVRGGRRNKKRGDATTFEPKPIISQERHLKDGMVQVGRLTYDSKLESCLGQGSSGTAVFPGTFDGRCVAVKRLVKTANSLAEKEIRHLVSSDEHPNVIRYHGKEESPSFFFIALDKFETSLDQFVEYHEKFPALVSVTRGYDVKDALRQITRGVQHLHSLKLVHRDIKPQNVLVRPIKSNRPLPDSSLTPLLFVISDFGLCKPLEDGPESVFAATRTAAGTTGWKAPELLVSSRDAIAAPIASQSSMSKSTTTSSDGTVLDPPTGRRATKAIDVFSLGCVFFYVMTRGGHPFDKGGSPLARDLNIKEDKYDTGLLRDSFTGYEYDADDLIMQMIAHNPKMRPDTAGVLQHPYFWKVEHKLDFLCAVSDAYEERKQKITNLHDENAPRTALDQEHLTELAALQEKAENVIGLRKDGSLQDFLQALPKSFLSEMGKQRKYSGTKMIDLLRVIRNKKNHFHDLPNEVKEMMLRPQGVGLVPVGQTEGYYSFWRDRFPSLLVNCHQLVQERGLVEEYGLERYYDGSLL